MTTRVLYIHWDDWWKSCSQNWTAFANWDIFLLNISLSIPHIMLTLLLFVILITCSHHLRSNYYITIYIIIKNIFLVHQGRARKQFFASGAGCSYYRDWGLVFSEQSPWRWRFQEYEWSDNLLTPEIPSTVTTWAGRNLSIFNNSPQGPFNSSSASYQEPQTPCWYEPWIQGLSTRSSLPSESRFWFWTRRLATFQTDYFRQDKTSVTVVRQPAPLAKNCFLALPWCTKKIFLIII